MSVESEREAVVEEVAGLFKSVLGTGRRRFLGGPRLPAALQDMTMAQFRGLFVLWHDQPLAIGALGDRLGIGLPGASRLVDRLVAERLVERYEDPADRRRALVRLAPRGLAALEEMQQGRRQMGGQLRRAIARLPDRQLAQLREAMAALAEASGQEAEEAPESEPALVAG
jgi:DNA-binding MarR family transcriptional regulator